MANSDRNRERQGADKGKNLGQGLAGINDKDRRDLAGDNPPTKDQRQSAAGQEKRQSPPKTDR